MSGADFLPKSENCVVLFTMGALHRTQAAGGHVPRRRVCLQPRPCSGREQRFGCRQDIPRHVWRPGAQVHGWGCLSGMCPCHRCRARAQKLAHVMHNDQVLVYLGRNMESHTTAGLTDLVFPFGKLYQSVTNGRNVVYRSHDNPLERAPAGMAYMSCSDDRFILLGVLPHMHHADTLT